MADFREYAVQAALAAVQCAVIQAGTIISVVLIRAAGYPDAGRDWPWLPSFIREWGPLAFGLPLSWVIVTILLEQRDPGRFTKRWTFFTGVLLVLALVAVYLFASYQGWKLAGAAIG